MASSAALLDLVDTLAMEAFPMTNQSVLERLRSTQYDVVCPCLDLRVAAADEIEGAHHDIERLMDACNAEVNEVERLRAALKVIANPANYNGAGEWVGPARRADDGPLDIALAALSAEHSAAEPSVRLETDDELAKGLKVLNPAYPPPDKHSPADMRRYTEPSGDGEKV